ncbi:S1 RNA-binding domain-containing protein [Streptococcus pneumoniae]|nr:S1 RNA-binding domain-containing protein [Streptococcus pneumoniae]
MCFTHSFFHFAILRKSLQTTSASPCRILELTSIRESLQTTLALSTTSKQCFEQPAASFLVCSLIFIEY